MAWVSAALFGAVAALVAATPASAGVPQDNQWVRFTNVKSAKAMALAENDGLRGTHAILWGRYSVNDQLWQWLPAGNGSYYLRNATSWRVLGIADGAKTDGAHAMLWDQNGNADQMWTPISVGNQGQLYLKNRNSGKCLGVAGGGTENGTHLMQWSCTRPDQLWDFWV